MLGQNILKNNGIFSAKLMKQLQREDVNLNNIIQDLERGSEKYITCIIEIFHNVKAMHYQPKQISKIFQTNLYSFNHDKIITKVERKCNICQLCKNNYKKRV